MLHLNCPICNGKVVSRCSCRKFVSRCENDHKFHYSIKEEILNKISIEIHNGLGDHFTDFCTNCEIVGTSNEQCESSRDTEISDNFESEDDSREQ